MTVEITRGFSFRIEVPNQYCVLILKSDREKLNINTLSQENGKCFLSVTAQATSKYRAGTYKYQLIDNTQILEQGYAVIRQNFSLTDENESVKSKNEVILQAIEAQIAGVATQAQSSISVGDKSISYMNLDELLKAKQYFKGKVAQEQGNFVSGNSGKILYKWSLK